jgi:hypothetical protein
MYTGPYTEVARDLAVAVRFEGKPLAGASVELFTNDLDFERLSKSTGADGTARFSSLKPGKYFLSVRHLEIFATNDNHVEVLPYGTPNAKSQLVSRWGEKPFEVRQIAGRVLTADPRANLLKQILSSLGGEFPVARAQLELLHPTNGKSYKTKSVASGGFTIRGVPDGTYVLRLEAGIGPGTFLVRVRPTAKNNSLRPVYRLGMCASGFELVP